jgi:hypothetical protein
LNLHKPCNWLLCKYDSVQLKNPYIWFIFCNYVNWIEVYVFDSVSETVLASFFGHLQECANNFWCALQKILRTFFMCP